MKHEPAPQEPGPTHAQKFDALLGRVLSVPKAEILRREAEYKKERALKKKVKGY